MTIEVSDALSLRPFVDDHGVVQVEWSCSYGFEAENQRKRWTRLWAKQKKDCKTVGDAMKVVRRFVSKEAERKAG